MKLAGRKANSDNYGKHCEFLQSLSRELRKDVRNYNRKTSELIATNSYQKLLEFQVEFGNSLSDQIVDVKSTVLQMNKNPLRKNKAEIVTLFVFTNLETFADDTMVVYEDLVGSQSADLANSTKNNMITRIETFISEIEHVANTPLT